jgi:hypothetical protein
MLNAKNKKKEQRLEKPGLFLAIELNDGVLLLFSNRLTS